MKILIVRIGAMGDVLHALPAVAALRAAQPDWEIDWAVDPRWAPLLVEQSGRGPLVARTIDVPTKEWNRRPFSLTTLRSVLQLRGTVREACYDIVVDMQGTLRSAVIGWFAGARVFAGYSDPRERLARWFYSRRVTRIGTHVVEQGAALLGAACGLELAQAVVSFPFDEAAEAWAELAVGRRPMAMLAPDAGWGAKRWPAERFGALAIELRAMGFDVVVNASSADDPLAARVVSASDGAASALPCSVAQLVALLRRTDLFVGGDSGPMHLAAAMAVPTVALFGPTDPARNGPWGPGRAGVVRDAASPTSYKRSAELDPGLGQLSVEAVVERIRRLIV
jgi:heptosyltransferase-1